MEQLEERNLLSTSRGVLPADVGVAIAQLAAQMGVQAVVGEFQPGSFVIEGFTAPPAGPENSATVGSNASSNSNDPPKQGDNVGGQTTHGVVADTPAHSGQAPIRQGAVPTSTPNAEAKAQQGQSAPTPPIQVLVEAQLQLDTMVSQPPSAPTTATTTTVPATSTATAAPTTTDTTSTTAPALASPLSPLDSSRLPIAFEANIGQVADPSVQYLARGSGYMLTLNATEAVFTLARSVDPSPNPLPEGEGSSGTDSLLPPAPAPIAADVLRMQIVGGNPAAAGTGLDELAGKVNVYSGQDSTRWLTGISTYGAVHYRDVYQGIDLLYDTGPQGGLETTWVVSAGADVNAIQLAYQGAEQISINEQGDLVVKTSGGEVVQNSPVLYQVDSAGVREIVLGGYVLNTDGTVGFQATDYDRSRALFIDPVLVYAANLGTSIDFTSSMAVDSAGNAYVTGTTLDEFFQRGVFVTKLNAAGNAALYTTLLFGDQPSVAFDIAIDSTGNAYVTGRTDGFLFPTTPGSLRPNNESSPAGSFVTKLDDLGNLGYSTFFAGNTPLSELGGTLSFSIAVDSAGAAYLTGTTSSNSFSTLGAFQETKAGSNSAFVAKLSPDGSSLVYASYLGETSAGIPEIAVDAGGEAFVTGSVFGPANFPLVNAFQATFGGGSTDSFLAKVNADGSALVYSTFLGGAGADFGRDLAVNALGQATIVGQTNQTNFHLDKAVQYGTGGNSDTYIATFSAAGALTDLIYHGGSGADVGLGVTIDAFGRILIAGQTSSVNLPLANAFQETSGGGTDAFVAAFDGRTQILSSYFGGPAFDAADAISLDGGQNIYIVGRTSSVFPSANIILPTFPGARSAFVAKFSPLPPSKFSLSGQKFEDLNGNGVKDLEDTPLEGWRIYIDKNNNQTFDPADEPTAVTLANGTYTITGLAPGTYTLREVLQPGWMPTTSADGSLTVTIGSADETGKDFGNFKTTQISGFKFNDLNGDGARQAGEPGLKDWTILLHSTTDDTFQRSALTNSDGFYSFANLGPGTYIVRELLQSGWIQTTIDPPDVTVSTSGQPAFDNANFGNFQLAQISGLKFEDMNQNEIRDPGERGLEGWNIFFDDNGNGEFDMSEIGTQTGADGSYSFTGLLAGNYTIREEIKEGWTQTTDDPPLLTIQSGSKLNPADVPGLAFGNFNFAVFGDRYSFSDPIIACGCLPPDSSVLGDPQDTGAGVYLHNGEFHYGAVDLSIPGRGFDWIFARNYRSGVQFDTPLGQNWDFSDNRRLRLVTRKNLGEIRLTFAQAKKGDVVRLDGLNRADLYVLQADGTYDSPNGFFTLLSRAGDGSFTERDQDGMVYTYAAPGLKGFARILSKSDRNDNTMRYLYDPATGRLSRVLDTMGRAIDYIYNTAGRLVEVKDFSGRSLKFTQDGNGDLTEVRSPIVSGTPTGNDFAAGKTERYTYSTGAGDPEASFATRRLNHNLVTITAPNEVASGGPPRVVLNYDLTADSPNADRVLSQFLGGNNVPGGSDVPAGGTITYNYAALLPPGIEDLSLPVFQTTVLDRNGNRADYQFNHQGNILRKREFTGPAVDAFFQTSYTYNADYQLLEKILPEGNRIIYSYDLNNPDRFQQNNLLAMILVADADRGGDQQTIVTSLGYEPIYNQVRTTTDPRGFISTNFFDYQESQELAGLAPDDRLNHNGIGRVNQSALIAVDPLVLTTEVWLIQELGLPETAAGLEELRFRLASSGVVLAMGDLNGEGEGATAPTIAGNIIRGEQPAVHLLEGSFQEALDGPIQSIVSLSSFNRLGQLTRTVDPEGNVNLYDYYSEQDPNGDGVIDNPTGDAFIGGYLKQEILDAESNPERDSGTNPDPAHIRHDFHYDIVGNLTRYIDGRGVATDYVVNELNQVVQITHAAEHGLYDAVDPMTGQPPATTENEPLTLTDFQYVERFYFDFNNNTVLRQTEDRGNTSNTDGNLSAADLPSFLIAADPRVADPLGGPAYVDTVIKYDILDKPIETIQEVGNGKALRTRTRYDRNENLVLTIQPAGNATSSVYDARDLLVQYTVGASARPVAGLYGPLDPGVVFPPGTPSNAFDRPGGTGTAPSTFTYRYDGNKNRVASIDAENNGSNPFPSTVGDITLTAYDGFDRPKIIEDALGNRTINAYDPASNVIRVIRTGDPTDDAVGDSISDNRTLAVTEFVLDELNRVVATHQVLFNSSFSIGAPIASPTLTDNPDMDALVEQASSLFYLPDAPSDTSSIPGVFDISVLGRITNLTEYDKNSRVTFTIDDALHVNRAQYDGVGRTIKTTDSALNNGFDFMLGEFNPDLLAGNTVEYAHDANNNAIEVLETDVSTVIGTTPETFRTTSFHDSLNRLEIIVDNLGQAQYYRYDSRGNLVAKADAVGPLTGTTLPRRGGSTGILPVVAVNDPGNVTLYAFDGINRTLETDVLLTPSGQGDGFFIGADEFGVKIPPPPGYLDTAQASDGIISTYFAWDDNSQLLARRDDNGNVTGYIYDNQGRKITERKALNEPGIFIGLTGGDFGSFGSSLKGGVTPENTRSGPTDIHFSYDRDSNLTGKVDEAGNSFTITYDPLNRRKGLVVSPVLGFIGTTQQLWTYDGLSRQTSSFDNNDPSTSEDDARTSDFYDSLSRLLEEHQQIGLLSSKSISYSYDIEVSNSVGQASSLTYPDGRRVDSFFDNLDRLTIRADSQTMFGPDGPETQLFVIAAYEYIGTNRVATLTYQNGTRLTYLDVETHTETREEVLFAGVSRSFGFNVPNKLVIENPTWTPDQWAGKEVRITSGPATGEVHTIVSNTNDTLTLDADWTIVPDQAAFEIFTEVQITVEEPPVDTGYDGLRREVNRRWETFTDNTPFGRGELIVGFTYTHDRANNRLTQEKLHDPNNSELYKYRSDYELTSFQRGTLSADKTMIISATTTEDALQAQTWTLDGVGNWTENTHTTNGTTDTEERTFSNVNEIASVTGAPYADGIAGQFKWDNNGNLLDDGLRTYQWDSLGRLHKVFRKSDGQQIAEYTYDAGNRRVRKEVLHGGLNGDTKNGITDFYYDGWRVLEEHDKKDNERQQYVYGNGLTEVWVIDKINPATTLEKLNDGKGQQRQFYYCDALGSIYGLADEQGSLQVGFQYDAYLRPMAFLPGDDGQVHFGQNGFFGSLGVATYFGTGSRRDAETGLYNLNNRYYSVEQSRFISRDPIGFAGGYNLYAYVGNNPANAADPMGLEGETSGQIIFNSARMRCAICHGDAQGWVNLAAYPYLANQAPADQQLAIAVTQWKLLDAKYKAGVEATLVELPLETLGLVGSTVATVKGNPAGPVAIFASADAMASTFVKIRTGGQYQREMLLTRYFEEQGMPKKDAENFTIGFMVVGSLSKPGPSVSTAAQNTLSPPGNTTYLQRPPVNPGGPTPSPRTPAITGGFGPGGTGPNVSNPSPSPILPGWKVTPLPGGGWSAEPIPGFNSPPFGPGNWPYGYPLPGD